MLLPPLGNVLTGAEPPLELDELLEELLLECELLELELFPGLLPEFIIRVPELLFENPSLIILLNNRPTLPLEKVLTCAGLGELMVIVLLPVLGSVIKVAPLFGLE